MRYLEGERGEGEERWGREEEKERKGEGELDLERKKDKELRKRILRNIFPYMGVEARIVVTS